MWRWRGIKTLEERTNETENSSKRQRHNKRRYGTQSVIYENI